MATSGLIGQFDETILLQKTYYKMSIDVQCTLYIQCTTLCAR